MDSLEEKIEKLKGFFSNCKTSEMKYHKIIELGRSLDKLSNDKKTSEYIVQGCQSQVFLYSCMRNGLIYFEAEADALVSSGLAALLIFVYSGEHPETILQSSPSYLNDLNIPHSLTPNRANGLYSIHLKMKQDAIRLLASNIHK